MSRQTGKLWMSMTAALTVILIVYLFPVFYSRYGLATAILFSLVLVVGMLLYCLRGVLMSQSSSSRSQNSREEEGRNK